MCTSDKNNFYVGGIDHISLIDAKDKKKKEILDIAQRNNDGLCLFNNKLD